MEVIMLTKEGCGSCKTFLPTAKEIAEELGYTFKTLNQPEIEVPFYPYFYIMKEGAILQQWGGVMERTYRNVLSRTQKGTD